MNIVAQIMSLIAFLVFISSVQMKEKKRLIFLQLIANLLYGISYLMLNAVEAFYMNLVSIVKCIILYFTKKSKPPVIYLYILTTIIILVGIYTCDTLISVIPIVITLLYTFSTWQNNMKIIRYIFLLAAILWIIYNISIGAYMIIIGNVFEIISGIVSIIRFNKKEEV